MKLHVPIHRLLSRIATALALVGFLLSPLACDGPTSEVGKDKTRSTDKDKPNENSSRDKKLKEFAENLETRMDLLWEQHKLAKNRDVPGMKKLLARNKILMEKSLEIMRDLCGDTFENIDKVAREALTRHIPRKANSLYPIFINALAKEMIFNLYQAQMRFYRLQKRKNQPPRYAGSIGELVKSRLVPPHLLLGMGGYQYETTTIRDGKGFQVTATPNQKRKGIFALYINDQFRRDPKNFTYSTTGYKPDELNDPAEKAIQRQIFRYLMKFKNKNKK